MLCTLCYSDVSSNDLLLSETWSEQVSDRGRGISGPGGSNQGPVRALLTNERPGNVIISVMRVSRCCHDAATLIPGPAPLLPSDVCIFRVSAVLCQSQLWPRSRQTWSILSRGLKITSWASSASDSVLEVRRTSWGCPRSQWQTAVSAGTMTMTGSPDPSTWRHRPGDISHGGHMWWWQPRRLLTLTLNIPPPRSPTHVVTSERRDSSRGETPRESQRQTLRMTRSPILSKGERGQWEEEGGGPSVWERNWSLGWI